MLVLLYGEERIPGWFVGGEDGLKGHAMNQGQKVPADIEAPWSCQQAKPPVSCTNDGQMSRPLDI